MTFEILQNESKSYLHTPEIVAVTAQWLDTSYHKEFIQLWAYEIFTKNNYNKSRNHFLEATQRYNADSELCEEGFGVT